MHTSHLNRRAKKTHSSDKQNAACCLTQLYENGGLLNAIRWFTNVQIYERFSTGI